MGGGGGAAPADAEEAPALPPLRLLCLHGRTQTGEGFAARLRPALRRLRGVLGATRFPDATGGAAGGGLQWYGGGGGADEAVRRLEGELQRVPPFDGVLGFSQGGALAAAALAAARADPAAFPALAALRFAVLAGAPQPPTGGAPLVHLAGVRSLHFVGEGDEAVPPNESEALAAAFGSGADVVRHAGGHIFPQRAEHVATLEAFLRARAAEAAAGGDAGDPGGEARLAAACGAWLPDEREAQREELGALTAIFGDQAVGGDCPRADEEEDEARCGGGGGGEEEEAGPMLLARVRVAEGVWLAAAFPRGYPHGDGVDSGQAAVPLLDIEGHALSEAARVALLAELVRLAEEERGNAMVYQLAARAAEWLDEHGGGEAADGEQVAGAQALAAAAVMDETADDSGDVVAESRLLCDELDPEEECALAQRAIEGARGIDSAAALRASDRRRGRWEYTVGLVGKPSAGKSTFFNAVTLPNSEAEAARMAAFPFTTIEPNIAAAFFSPPAEADPCREGGERGYAERLTLPVTIKDVAGLVPGACQGAGKGNAFLNDLCDADSLIHVIDASGTTLSDGAAAGTDADAQGDPARDVEWVQLELHMWIYQNVRNKWPTVLRKLMRSRADEPSDYFLQLFVGYHCTTSVAFEAVRLAGFGRTWAEAVKRLPSWTPADLHAIVATFCAMRFPCVLALNKADLPSSGRHIRRIRESYPGVASTPVCARAEYQAHVEAGEQMTGREQVEKLAADYATELTGCRAALNAAVALRPPVFAFPTTDDVAAPAEVARLRAVGKAADGAVLQAARAACPLAIAMRPGSTAEDLFAAAKLGPQALVEGDLVRVEVLDQDGETRAVPRDTPLDGSGGAALAGGGALAVRLLATRRSRWQRGAGRAASAGGGE